MNADRRKQINEISEKLGSLLDDIQGIHDEEEGAFDSMPENLQGSEKGEKVQAAVDALQEALDNVESAVSALETAAE